MLLNVLRFLSVMLTAIALAGGLAHLFELPNKMPLSRDDYLTVQQIYRGWVLLGIPIFGALVTTLLLAVMERRRRRVFALTLAAARSSSRSRFRRTRRRRTGFGSAEC